MVQSRGQLLEATLCTINTEYNFKQWIRDFPATAADASAEETHDLAITLVTELRDLERPWSENEPNAQRQQYGWFLDRDHSPASQAPPSGRNL